MKSKEHILNEAYDLMRKIGIQAMTMDLVAARCGMSKRTLYEQFGSKAELVTETLQMVNEQMRQKLQKIFQDSENCLEALMRTFLEIHDSIENTPAVLQHDIQKLYPEIEARHKCKNSDFVTALAQVLRRGQSEGLILSCINVEVASFVVIASMHTLHELAQDQVNSVNAIDVFDTAFTTLMRGIGTMEGIRYIDEFMASKSDKLNKSLK